MLCVKLVGSIYSLLALSVKKIQHETAYSISGQQLVLDFSYLPIVYCTYKRTERVNHIPLAVTDFIAIFNKPSKTSGIMLPNTRMHRCSAAESCIFLLLQVSLTQILFHDQ